MCKEITSDDKAIEQSQGDNTIDQSTMGRSQGDNTMGRRGKDDLELGRKSNRIHSLGWILNIRLPSGRESLSKGILLLRVSYRDVVIIP